MYNWTLKEHFQLYLELLVRIQERVVVIQSNNKANRNLYIQVGKKFSCQNQSSNERKQMGK